MRQWVRNIVKRRLARRGFSVKRLPPSLCLNPNGILKLSFDHILCHYLLSQGRAKNVPVFLQIGAFDGVSGDPLYPYVKRGLLKGCLLEPQADAFEQLRKNYAGVEGISLKRAAIGPQSGTATLYRVRPGTVGPVWLFQIASFSRDALMKTARAIPDLEQAIITEVVPTVTFDELWADFQEKPDIVVIDTEGYDFEVIKLLNVANRRPSIILYEHKLLSPTDENACIELLLKAGYEVAPVGSDTVAYLTGNR